MMKCTIIFLVLSILLACLTSTTTALGGNWFIMMGLLKEKDVEHRVDNQAKLVSRWRNREDKVTREMDDTKKKNRNGDEDEPYVKNASVQKPLAFATRTDPSAMHRGSY